MTQSVGAAGRGGRGRSGGSGAGAEPDPSPDPSPDPCTHPEPRTALPARTPQVSGAGGGGEADTGDPSVGAGPGLSGLPFMSRVRHKTESPGVSSPVLVQRWDAGASLGGARTLGVPGNA